MSETYLKLILKAIVILLKLRIYGIEEFSINGWAIVQEGKRLIDEIDAEIDGEA